MDAEALDEMDDATIESRLPDRPVTSIRDVQSLYGTLYALGRGLTSEYGPYLSPDAADDIVGNERLLVVWVDLTGESPRLREDKPADEQIYVSEANRPTNGIFPDVEHVAHSKFEAARGVDHSVTHQSGQSNGPVKHADHAVERLTRWPTEDAVQAEAEEHDDGWVIEALAALGEDEDAMERLHDEVEDAGLDEQWLHTVALKVDADDVATTDLFEPDADWHLPGEIEVLQEAMVRRKTAKFRAKNDAKDAVGDGVCYVGDGEEPVYGVVDDPLKWYLSKQMEKFPRFDPDESWRTQGLGREAAIAAQNATTFLEACGEPGPGVTAFYFPYFEDGMSVDEASMLYSDLVTAADENWDSDDGSHRNVVADLYEDYRDEDGDVGRLRFAFVVVSKYQKDRWRLLAFEPDATVHFPYELAAAHQEVLDSPWFEGDDLFPTPDEFALLTRGWSPGDWLSVVGSVGYFAWTVSGADEDEPSSDDLRFRATANVVGGRGVDAEALLSAYVDRIAEAFDPSSEYPFSDALVASQYAQLSALANAGLLNAETNYTVNTDMTANTRADGSELNRAETLDRFIEKHDALDDERLGVFALGALVGRISRYQRAKNRSMTAVKRHPIDKLTRHNVRDVATSVVDSNVVYSDEEGYNGTMYAELMDEVVEGLLNQKPADWSLSTDDLRFHYAMGIAYGLNDRSTSDYDNE
jgi:hypothetical protein